MWVAHKEGKLTSHSNRIISWQSDGHHVLTLLSWASGSMIWPSVCTGCTTGAGGVVFTGGVTGCAGGVTGCAGGVIELAHC